MQLLKMCGDINPLPNKLSGALLNRKTGRRLTAGAMSLRKQTLQHAVHYKLFSAIEVMLLKSLK